MIPNVVEVIKLAIVILVRGDNVEVVETVCFSQIPYTFVVQGAVDTVDAIESPIRVLGITTPLTEVRYIKTAV